MMFTYERIQRFNETEIQIYKYIQANRDKVHYMTIRELAGELHISTSGIIRFCEKIGCDSYSEFKQRLKDEAERTEEIAPESDLEELLHYFRGTNTGAFEAKIREGAEMIRDADMVIFIGQGASGALAKYGARYFSNLGWFSVGLEDSYYPLVQMKDKKMAVIVLSVTGETKEIIAFMDACRACSARILSITNQPDSTIARMSDWNISYFLDLKRMYGIYNATSQVPTLFLIEALARRLQPDDIK